MKQTWRWFGPQDNISIDEIRQTGAQGIVSALHQHRPGAIWPIDDIKKRQAEIAFENGKQTGLKWDVVESLPVSESIKRKDTDFKAHIAAYKQSLENLAACGLDVICYNFMPVLDWTRTTLSGPVANGGEAMFFDIIDFAVFDCFILQRQGAADDYESDNYEMAKTRYRKMDDAQKRHLAQNIVAGLPGANDNWTLDDVRRHLSVYDGMTSEQLRQNLIDFLSEVAPVADKLGLRLCCHPDDPPFPLLGLPRIMSCQSDYHYVMEQVNIKANGITFCTGSLGVDPDFDPLDFIKTLGTHIHFVHLRNTKRHDPKDGVRHSFFESEHLGGDTDMVAVIKALLEEEQKRKQAGRHDHQIPMRPDHGHRLLSDFNRQSNPGYPLIGRLRGLAELRGIMTALQA
ncbi:MAG: mannonate dehydratase [Candidatus Puniceispirillaceae bacterium]